MKPIYKILELTSAALQISLALQAKVNDGTEENETPISADMLESLRVELIAPNVSGARDLIKSGECRLLDDRLIILLITNDWLKGGTYRLQVSATFGTQTMVIYALDINVPRYNALSSIEAQEYGDTVTVVSTVGGSSGGGADATVYALDGNGNAEITTPLTVSGSVREGQNTTASQNSHAEGNGTTASGQNSHAEGNTTTASGAYSHAEGSSTTASQLNSHAEGYVTNASGDYSHAEGIGTNARGSVSHAEGNSTTASGGSSHAEGSGTTASGDNSHAEGNSTTARGQNSHAEGSSTNAEGNVSHAEGNVSHAEGSVSHAEGNSTTASGDNSHAEGNSTIARGHNSHAEGNSTIAAQENQHVCGQFNVADNDNLYQLIVGNGADNDNRHNAFAITKSGELALFKADGTPVILSVANLEALIASLA